MAPSKTARRALGRGLSNLIPQDSVERGSGNEVVAVDIQAIRPNPFQPRNVFSEEEIAHLAESIKTQGLLQPVLLRKTPAGYEIISGERRVRAMRKLGRPDVPAIVKPTVTDGEMLELALVENLQREDLNPIECARGYDRLLHECGLSHEELSVRMGKSRSAITNTLRMLKLPAEVQEMVSGGSISAGHARALAAIDDREKQLELARAIVRDGLSVRGIETLLRRPKGPAAGSSGTGRPADPNIESLLERLRYRLGTAVALKANNKGKGKIEIRFLGYDDLNRIAQLLGV